MSNSAPPSPRFQRQVPHGDTHERDVCDHCGHINYQNPKVVVGSVVALDGRVLLCRRAIEPRQGFWTLPAGYMELGETPEHGARREAQEEAEAEIVLDGVLAIYSIARLGQVQIIYRARFAVRWALDAWRANPVDALGAPAGNPVAP